MLQELMIVVSVAQGDGSPVPFGSMTPNPRQVAIGPQALFYDANAQPRIFWNVRKDGSVFEQATATGGGGGGGGGITRLIDASDYSTANLPTGNAPLVAALAAKYATPAGTTSQYVRGDGSLASFPAFGTGDMTLSAIQTVTAAKTFNDSTLLLAGSTSGNLTLRAAAVSGTASWSFPAGTDTVAGAASTTTFTGKTFDTAGSGNVFKIAGVTLSTVTGTGAVCLANSPSFTTPALGTPSAGNLSNCTNIPSGQITGLSGGMLSFLQGGTSALLAAALSDETGSAGGGLAVFNNSPSIISPTLTGIVTTDAANITTANAMAALDINVAKGLNTKTIAADSTFTFSAVPGTNQWFSMLVKNSDTNPHTLTIPSSFSLAVQAARTAVVIPASGQLWLTWRYDGSAYNLFGDAGYASSFGTATNPGVTNDGTQGYGPGSLWGNTSTNTLYWCESNATGAAVWNLVSGSGSGDVLLAGVQTFTGAKTFNDATLVLAGSTSGTLTLHAAAVAGSGSITFPAGTDTLVGKATTDTLTNKTFDTAGTGNVFKVAGVTISAVTGTGSNVLSNSPTLVTPALGTPSAMVATNVTGLPLSTGVTGTLAAANMTAMGASGGSHSAGIVPDPGASAGTVRFLREDATWATPAGGGTVTNSGNLVSNGIVLGTGTTGTQTAAGLSTDGVSVLNLGVAGTSVGKLTFANATSGTIQLVPATGALGTTVYTMPSGSANLVTDSATQALTNKTYNGNTLTAGTWTLTGAAGKTLAFNASVTFAGTDGTTMTFPSTSGNVSVDNTVSTQSTNYTFVIGDKNTTIMHPAADTTARTWTIPANASVAYPTGTILHIKNQLLAGALTLAITTDTLTWARAAGGTGSRTLGPGGEASIMKVGATAWEIVGNDGLS